MLCIGTNICIYVSKVTIRPNKLLPQIAMNKIGINLFFNHFTNNGSMTQWITDLAENAKTSVRIMENERTAFRITDDFF